MPCRPVAPFTFTERTTDGINLFAHGEIWIGTGAAVEAMGKRRGRTGLGEREHATGFVVDGVKIGPAKI